MVQSLDIHSSTVYGIIIGVIVFVVVYGVLHISKSPEFKKSQLRAKAQDEERLAAIERAKQKEKEALVDYERRVEERYQKLLKKENL